jgi:hypothetical protein
MIIKINKLLEFLNEHNLFKVKRGSEYSLYFTAELRAKSGLMLDVIHIGIQYTNDHADSIISVRLNDEYIEGVISNEPT